jgi:hypothetical protein
MALVARLVRRLLLHHALSLPELGARDEFRERERPRTMSEGESWP